MTIDTLIKFKKPSLISKVDSNGMHYDSLKNPDLFEPIGKLNRGLDIETIQEVMGTVQAWYQLSGFVGEIITDYLIGKSLEVLAKKVNALEKMKALVIYLQKTPENIGYFLEKFVDEFYIDSATLKCNIEINNYRIQTIIVANTKEDFKAKLFLLSLMTNKIEEYFISLDAPRMNCVNLTILEPNEIEIKTWDMDCKPIYDRLRPFE